MRHWGISVKTMPQEISVSALFPPQRLLCVVGREKEGALATSPRACSFVIMDTQQEPLWRREVSATKKGRRNDLK